MLRTIRDGIEPRAATQVLKSEMITMISEIVITMIDFI